MPERPFVTAIIAAGGRGQRFGAARPKQMVELAGQTILERSVRLCVAHPAIDEVIVALPADLAADPPAYLRAAGTRVQVVEGGTRRQDSVANAFAAASPLAAVVVVHDAARPLASADLFERTIAAALETGAALAATASRDTVKQAGAGHLVTATIPRETVYLAQTPQAFRREVLAAALAAGQRDGVDATDEAALAERAGFPVRLVDGEMTNIKITTPADLRHAEAIVSARGADLRVGIGYDLHRLVEGRPLILGGVTIPFERGLAGHSDADAICHAVTDAVLGAVAAGDIGRHFPDTDEAWRGASSIDLLRRAAASVNAQGWQIVNVDVVVIAEQPKLAPWVDAMRASVAAALDVGADRVSIKGKTNEGIGELGRGEAIATHATALLRNGGRVE